MYSRFRISSCFPHPSFALPRGSQSLGNGRSRSPWLLYPPALVMSHPLNACSNEEWRAFAALTSHYRSVCPPMQQLLFALSLLIHSTLIIHHFWLPSYDREGIVGQDSKPHCIYIKILYQTSGKHLTLHGAVITRWSLYIRHRFWFQTVGPTAPLKHWQCMHSFWKGHILLRNSSIYIIYIIYPVQTLLSSLLCSLPRNRSVHNSHQPAMSIWGVPLLLSKCKAGVASKNRRIRTLVPKINVYPQYIAVGLVRPLLATSTALSFMI